MSLIARALACLFLVLCLGAQAIASTDIDRANAVSNAGTSAPAPAPPPSSPPSSVQYVPCPPDAVVTTVKVKSVHRAPRRAATHRHHKRRKHHRTRRHRRQVVGAKRRPTARRPTPAAAPLAKATRCRVIQRGPVNVATLTSFISPPDAVVPPSEPEGPVTAEAPPVTAPANGGDDTVPGAPFAGVPDDFISGLGGVARLTGPVGSVGSPSGGPSPPGPPTGGLPPPPSGPPPGQVSAVPEPGTWAFMLGGAAAIGVALRVRRRRSLAGGPVVFASPQRRRDGLGKRDARLIEGEGDAVGAIIAEHDLLRRRPVAVVTAQGP